MNSAPVGLVAALALLTLAPPSASAESLEAAWVQALSRDPVLAAAAEDVEAARAGERAARGARLPSIEAGATYTRFADAPALDVTTANFAFRSPRIFDADDTIMAFAQLKLPLYTGGSLSSGLAAARQTSRAAGEDQRRTVADLKFDIARSYIGVLRARRASRTSESSVESLKAHVSDVSAMVDREMVATSDLLAARVALANASQQQLQASNGVQLAYATYNRRLGQPLDRVPELEEVISVDSALANAPLAALIERARASRSELAGQAARASALGAQSRAEWGRQLPQLALVGGYNHFETTILDRQDFSTIGIGVTWNLFDGGQARNRAASLRRASRAAELRLDDLQSRIELEVRDAWLGLHAAESRIAVSRESVAQADENLRISRELYGAGLATNTQVLDAVALRVSAANNADDAVLDATLAQLAIARAVGSL